MHGFKEVYVHSLDVNMLLIMRVSVMETGVDREQASPSEELILHDLIELRLMDLIRLLPFQSPYWGY